MQIICPNSVHGFGCAWKGELQEVCKHRLECPREVVMCTYSVVGCKERMCRDKMTKHEDENHLDCTVKMVVSMATTIKELQGRIEQLEITLHNLSTQFKQGIT